MKLSRRDLFKQIGISVVTIGLGIGSGEFILWPYLSYHWGFSLLWGALLGIAMQVFLNIEIQRYALSTGKSLVHGAYSMNKYLGTWFILSTIIGFGWPGFSAGAAYLITNVLNPNSTGTIWWLPVFVLLLAGGLLVAGKNVYHRIEKILKVIIPISFFVILIIFLNFFEWESFKQMLLGIVGFNGNSFELIPKGINLSVLLSAIVYAGSGGNLLLSQAYYVLEKDKFSTSFKENRMFQIFENIFVFGGIGLLTILMLSYLGRVLTLPISAILNDISFIPAQSFFISQRLGSLFGMLYIIAGAVALFSVQLGVLDLLGRICRELFNMRFGKDSHQIYSFAVIIQVVFGSLILLSGVNQPLWLIVTGAVFNALAMGVISIITLLLNTQLKDEYRPKLWAQITLGLVSCFYISFFVLTFLGK